MILPMIPLSSTIETALSTFLQKSEKKIPLHKLGGAHKRV
ncbi:hypothetical protein COO91_00518 [Nostoc flagelliforme CCNUN1]|uniref:Uncharacterized protein n=1 Tax=Nostoc flagelliforme CCNUN1 TaxID=2038116 RepID=A0A2K8SGY4_9NOSO|nr:hypothetical protein COO91_00518 [Nostoc flagelliforme CCNUN1]